MDILQAIHTRHSVRAFTEKKIEDTVREHLQSTVDELNNKSGLNMQLCFDEPKAFSSMLAKYGKFKNANNYIALVGKKGDSLQEMCGYYGEHIVLKAQQLGLNTCWVALTFSKGKCPVIVNDNEKFLMVIAIGYGETAGVQHKNKPIESLYRTKDEIIPEWFKQGMVMAQLAPTAINQQRFLFELDDNNVSAKALFGSNTKVDLGIVKYHFEIGANSISKDWNWKK